METKQLAYFVYIHTFPNGKKYVGCTTRKPECRWREGKLVKPLRKENNPYDVSVDKYSKGSRRTSTCNVE